ncbi:acyl-ACP--UDP-N-acetylglucosamine O-acyltransferase [Botrimarina hoheduenensis]|uniref:Acyl-[acyl-carrier-protein]--UDP-N-acetylglucosamine O-acyltransferase n=1 Tax=Botrimarina hoheduenensis TaxID=2528000 RepID=A0A5C5WEV2_9BACT|nr:acyl-ACP--UDP-N-acetylglucosamine O-acyltransferase [Botrimarina hoheduenensis]TWT48633.1 Acyl-[acyl-carrier-protein]--UDP-N-acetylglucosamine O-acyltransferase [Botrimarina hoheduenensis]
MPTKIAANAWIDPRAQIDEGVEIGPLCVIGAGARIAAGTRLINSVTIMGRVDIGRDNVIYPGSVIGGEPQDISYSGAETLVEIGDGNLIREGVTINRASEKEDGITRVGNHNFLMASAHVAHDCKLGDHIIIANGTLLGGHVHVADRASISGGVAVHHYTTIGSFSFIGGLSRVLHDVPPYMLCEGSPARPRCINIVALKRNNFTSEDINCLAEAHRLIYRSKVGVQAAQDVLSSSGKISPAVANLFDFIEGQTEGRHGRGRDGKKRAAAA